MLVLLATLRGLVAHLAFPDPLTRSGAADEARRELAKQIYARYRPSLATRIIRWVLGLIDRIITKVVQVVPGGGVGLLVIAVVLAAVVVLVLRTLGRPALGELFGGDLDAGSALTAAQLRAQAEVLAGREEWAEAVRARMRAIARHLEEAGVIDVRPGRTALEVAADGGSGMRDQAPALRDAAVTFDEIWYGHRTADAGSYRRITEVDAGVARRSKVLVG